MDNRFYIVGLEPIETRYTIDWKWFLPKKIQEFVDEYKLQYRVVEVPGRGFKNDKPTEGAFLNFANTNIYKNDQSSYIAQLFSEGQVRNGDKFLFADAWNPAIIQVRYMSSLLKIPVEIHSIWHAGSYDPNDFLGRCFDKNWSYDFERSLFYASDKNYFATEYHLDLFLGEMKSIPRNTNRAVICGFPFDYLKEKINFDPKLHKKENIILFPHRISAEKQLNIFLDLQQFFPAYQFIVSQELNPTKEQYYDLLRKSQMVFSANLQETLGISMYEAVLARAYPYVPNRLSYQETLQYIPKYKSKYTESFGDYMVHRERLVNGMTLALQDQIAGDQVRYEAAESHMTREFYSMKKMLYNLFNI